MGGQVLKKPRTPGEPITFSFSNPSKPKENNDVVYSKVQRLTIETQRIKRDAAQARSDKIEVMRDLAAY